MANQKYHRVKKNTFMWDAGAILVHDADTGRAGGYTAISDVWDVAELDGEYISARIIENNPDWFERVYKVSTFGKAVYMTRDLARVAVNKAFKAN